VSDANGQKLAAKLPLAGDPCGHRRNRYPYRRDAWVV
jgi:hypothetical protein